MFSFSRSDANTQILMFRIRTDRNQKMSFSPGHYHYDIHVSHVSPSLAFLFLVALKANDFWIGDQMVVAIID